MLYKDRHLPVSGSERHERSQTAFVAAFDKATGRTLWQTPRTQTVGWGTPVVVDIGDRDELVVSGQSRVAAYDPDTGRELWTVRGMTFEVIPTPVVGHGLVFASSGRAGPTLAIRPGGSGDVTATHVAWSTPRGSPFVPSGIVVGDLLYLVNDMQSILTVYEAKTGALVYQARMGDRAARGLLGLARRGERQGASSPTTRGKPSWCRPGASSSCCTSTSSARAPWRRPRSSTAPGTGVLPQNWWPFDN